MELITQAEYMALRTDLNKIFHTLYHCWIRHFSMEEISTAPGKEGG